MWLFHLDACGLRDPLPALELVGHDLAEMLARAIRRNQASFGQAG